MFHNFLMTMAPLKNDTNLRELSCNIYFKIVHSQWYRQGSNLYATKPSYA